MYDKSKTIPVFLLSIVKITNSFFSGWMPTLLPESHLLRAQKNSQNIVQFYRTTYSVIFLRTLFSLSLFPFSSLSLFPFILYLSFKKMKNKVIYGHLRFALSYSIFPSSFSPLIEARLLSFNALVHASLPCAPREEKIILILPLAL